MAHPYQKHHRTKQKIQAYPAKHGDGKIHIYTDGSASTADKSGGWGVYIICGDEERTISGAQWDATIGEMELRAVLGALSVLRATNREVVVYIDSQYVVQALTQWWPQWRSNRWRTASGKKVKHVDILKQIITLSDSMVVAFKWVKGHAGNLGNEIADGLAGTARRDLQLIRQMVNNMSDANQWQIIAKRHASGLADIFSDTRGWSCKHPIMLWTYYLCCSYMYYERDCSIVSDEEFDRLCKYLHRIGKQAVAESGAWWVSQFWDDSAMAAGSGYHMHGKVPVGIQNIAELLYEINGHRPYEGSTEPQAYMGTERIRTRRRTRATLIDKKQEEKRAKAAKKTRKRTRLKR